MLNGPAELDEPHGHDGEGMEYGAGQFVAKVADAMKILVELHANASSCQT